MANKLSEDLLKRKKKKKKLLDGYWEVEEQGTHPVHEQYVKEGDIKRA